jgi:uncharacterized membrane protein
LEDRLDRLEQTVSDLARELRTLSEAVDRLERAGSRASAPPVVPSLETSRLDPAIMPVAPPPVAPSAEPAFASVDAGRRVAERRAVPDRRAVDFESLIGRYGTLGLASLTILMGAGAFLSWAIAQGKIGPGTRVFLGALGAAAVAVAGWRLRARGSMRFGSTLLALALALVHVDAWGAGPYLKIVPSSVALGLAAVASIALAALAWYGNEEALFSVGVGGAVLAPFVTSSGSGNVPALLIYGYIVMASGLAALRGRSWKTAASVVTLGIWIYSAASAAGTRGDAQGLARDYPAIFALAIAWTAIVVTRGLWGTRIARSAIVALLGILAAQVIDRSPAADLLVLAVLGSLTAYGAVHVSLDGLDPKGLKSQPVLTGALLPLALGAVAIAAVRDGPMPRTFVALGWTAIAVAAAFLQRPARSTHLMVAGIASGAAIVFGLEDRDVETCIALSAHAAALSVWLRRERTRLLGVPIAIGLVIVTVWTFGMLDDRPLYGYTPFLTPPSVAALAMSVAWLVVSWNAARVEFADGSRVGSANTQNIVRVAGAAITFLWGNVELARAYSADISTFLLIGYYAVVGVAAIFVGRARAIPILRHVGLALSIFAALKAIAEASSLAIGIRVGSYFLAGLFLLAVAYWYREKDKLGSDPNFIV